MRWLVTALAATLLMGVNGRIDVSRRGRLDVMLPASGINPITEQPHVIIGPPISGYHEETQDYLTRISEAGGGMDSFSLPAVDGIVKSAHNDGWREKIWYMAVFNAATNTEGALVTLFHGTNIDHYIGLTNLSNVNFASVDLDYRGLKGDGSSKYLKTGFPNNANNSTNSSIGAFYTTFAQQTGFRVFIGARKAGTYEGQRDAWVYADGANTNLGACGGGNARYAFVGSPVGASMVSMSSLPGAMYAYIDGELVASNATQADAATDAPLFVFQLSEDGAEPPGGSYYNESRLSAVFVGDGLTSEDHANIYSALTAFNAAMSSGAYSAYRFVRTGFRGDNDGRLYVWMSRDGKTWDAINDAAIFASPSGTLRDPSIISVGGTNYIAYTRATGNSSSFGIAVSVGLTNWVHLADVETAVAGADRVWSPEFFVDQSGSNHLFVAVSADSGSTFKIYHMAAEDATMTNWTDGVDVGLGTNKIDPFVFRDGSTYVMSFKNEATKYVELATSATLTSGYVVTHTNDWAGWGNEIEGPQFVSLGGQSWRAYLDDYTDPMGHQYYWSESTNGISGPWTSKVTLIEKVRSAHGTIISY